MNQNRRNTANARRDPAVGAVSILRDAAMLVLLGLIVSSVRIGPADSALEPLGLRAAEPAIGKALSGPDSDPQPFGPQPFRLQSTDAAERFAHPDRAGSIPELECSADRDAAEHTLHSLAVQRHVVRIQIEKDSEKASPCSARERT